MPQSVREADRRKSRHENIQTIHFVSIAAAGTGTERHAFIGGKSSPPNSSSHNHPDRQQRQHHAGQVEQQSTQAGGLTPLATLIAGYKSMVALVMPGPDVRGFDIAIVACAADRGRKTDRSNRLPRPRQFAGKIAVTARWMAEQPGEGLHRV
jgi:hypothetical protein